MPKPAGVLSFSKINNFSLRFYRVIVMILRPTCDGITLGTCLIIFIFHQIDSIMRDWRPVFILLSYNLLRIFLHRFSIYPRRVCHVAVWPGVVMVQWFAVDGWTCHSVCKSGLPGCTVFSLVHLVRQILFDRLLMAWTRGQDSGCAAYLFILRI